MGTQGWPLFGCFGMQAWLWACAALLPLPKASGQHFSRRLMQQGGSHEPQPRHGSQARYEPQAHQEPAPAIAVPQAQIVYEARREPIPPVWN